MNFEKHQLKICAITYIFLLLLSCSQSGNEKTPNNYGSVSGKIINNDTGEGIPGIEIDIYGLYKDYDFETSTDKDGNFNFKEVPKGVYKITPFTIYKFCPKGLVISKMPKTFKVPPGKNIKNINIYLQRGAEISGYVYAADGVTPLKNIEIEILPHPARVCHIVETDGQGKYVFKGLEGGHKEIAHNTPGFATECMCIEVKPGKIYENVNFILGRGNVSVRGKVVSTRDNKIIPGIFIFFEDKRLNKYYSSGEAESNSSGEYSLIGLRYPGTFELATVDPKEEYVDIECDVELKLGENILDIKLKPKKK